MVGPRRGGAGALSGVLNMARVCHPMTQPPGSDHPSVYKFSGQRGILGDFSGDTSIKDLGQKKPRLQGFYLRMLGSSGL
jgi:hypothetical protein